MTNVHDTTIIEMLTRRVRCITAAQAARLSFKDTRAPVIIAKQWLGRQERSDLVTLQTIPTHPELCLRDPFLDYRPDDPLPSFEALAWKAKSRWRLSPRMTLIATATDKARTLTGGVVGGRTLRAREATHDIHVTSVFLRLHEVDPAVADTWIPEDLVRAEINYEYLAKVPDAIIIAGDKPIIIEFAGSYSAKKLRTLHHEYAALGRYQLW